MKWAITIAVGALIIGTLFFQAYVTVGWHYFNMPFPHLVGPMFHLDGEGAEDAVYAEIWLEFIAVTALALIGARFALGRLSN